MTGVYDKAGATKCPFTLRALAASGAGMFAKPIIITAPKPTAIARSVSVVCVI
ncbi:hypothetical protein [Novosphingobium sp. AP12]|uniref:hypothetical protein n=1 Tax=Novosphingobium sp. AP12 TaxID=1144305 RepID=UPI0012FBB0EE|nr:hypothetical protein [Novosphingobium sp. AP12]